MTETGAQAQRETARRPRLSDRGVMGLKQQQRMGVTRPTGENTQPPRADSTAVKYSQAGAGRSRAVDGRQPTYRQQQ